MGKKQVKIGDSVMFNNTLFKSLAFGNEKYLVKGVSNDGTQAILLHKGSGKTVQSSVKRLIRVK